MEHAEENIQLKDIRIKKTMKSLQYALLRLLNNKPLDKISVASLCKEAEVSRMAFYSHYSIIEDCFFEIFKDMMVEFDRSVRKRNLDIDQVMREYLLMVQGNRTIFRVIYNLGYHHPLVQMTYKQYFQYWNDISPEKDLAFQEIYIRFTTYGHFGLVSDWVEDGCIENVDDILNLHRRFTEISKEFVQGL